MYEARYSQTFNDKLEEPHLANLLEDIKRKAELVMQAPYGAAKSERLRHDWAGKRSARIDDRYRLIYKVCEECQRRGEGEPNHMIDCLSCESVPVTTVNFLDITDHYL